MSDSATLRIEIDDVTSRDNALLDEAMGMSRATPAGGAPTMKAFPATVRGDDGRQYGMGEYLKAADRAQKEVERNRADQAYQAFFSESAPAFPATVMGPDGKRYDFKAFKAATARANREAESKNANDAYRSLYGGPLTPPDTVKGADGRKYKSTDDYFAARDAKGGSGILDEIIGKLGGGGIMRALGMSGGGATAMGGAGAASAIPIVGGAIMALNQLTGTVNRATAAVASMGNAAEKVARNEMPDFRKGLDDGITAVADSLPIIGDAVAAGPRLASAIGKIPEQLTAAFMTRAHEIGGYSAAISRSEAFAEARSLRADVREANELGPEMARLIDAQSNIDNTLREALLPIKKVVVDLLADRLEKMGRGLDIVINLPEIITVLVRDLGEVIRETGRLHFGDAKKAIERIPRDINEVLKQRKAEDDGPKDMFDEFMRALDAPQNQWGG